MIKERTKDVLIKMGMPASILGLKYIADAMELFDSGLADIKIIALYDEIGRKNKTTGTGVERAIRHALESVIAKGRREVIEKYMSYDNTTNSNMLKLLYYRLKQEERETANTEPSKTEVINQDPYYELEADMILAVQKFIKKLREESSDVCSEVD